MSQMGLRGSYENTMKRGRALMLDRGTGPKNRLSWLTSRLSPIAKKWPSGTT
jgi:hypothetical protein